MGIKAQYNIDYSKVDYLSRSKLQGTCLMWSGVNHQGYGVISQKINGIFKRRGAHVVIFEQQNRKLLPGEVVRHACNNKGCINPKHLLAGSQKDNIHDSIRAGTHVFPPKGENHQAAKLNVVKVLRLRKLAALGLTSFELAAIFKLNRRTVSNIIERKIWKEV